jgi:hypothetical protein
MLQPLEECLLLTALTLWAAGKHIASGHALEVEMHAHTQLTPANPIPAPALPAA